MTALNTTLMPGSAQVLLGSVVFVLTWRWLGGFYCAPCCAGVCVNAFCGSFAVLLRTATRTQLSLCWAFAVRLWKHSMRSRRDVAVICAGAWRARGTVAAAPREGRCGKTPPFTCALHIMENNSRCSSNCKLRSTAAIQKRSSMVTGPSCLRSNRGFTFY